MRACTTKNAASSVTLNDTTAHVCSRVFGLEQVVAWACSQGSAWSIRPGVLSTVPSARGQSQRACLDAPIHCNRTPTTGTDELTTSPQEASLHKPSQAPAARAIMRLAACSGQGRPCTMQAAPGRILRTYASDRAMGRLRRRRPHSEYMNRIDSSIFL